MEMLKAQGKSPRFTLLLAPIPTGGARSMIVKFFAGESHDVVRRNRLLNGTCALLIRLATVQELR
jgi:hypothetical protein